MVSMPELGRICSQALTLSLPESPHETLLPALSGHLQPPPAWAGHPQWPDLMEAARARLSRHGDLPRWSEALLTLPDLQPTTAHLAHPVGAAGPIGEEERARLRRGLLGLHPWRKGPFDLFGVHVESEWRSDMKWRRIARALGTLDGQQVLDVGCGNGYFGWRMLEAGAEAVLGVDPSVLFFLQHLAVSRYLGPLVHRPHILLPLSFESMPPVSHDLVLSMGVIYHRPDPAAHVDMLARQVRPGGRLLLESLVVESGPDLVPGRQQRYARMRNVSVVPRVDTMVAWLRDAGLVDVEVVDVSRTTPEEQRSTRWMTFESLAQALDPDDPTRTVEGHPAPVRAAVLARRPG